MLNPALVLEQKCAKSSKALKNIFVISRLLKLFNFDFDKLFKIDIIFLCVLKEIYFLHFE